MRSAPLINIELHYDDEVMIPWGSTEIRGRVAEVYGPQAGRRVVVTLEPELSSYVVAEATTIALPIAHVRKVVPLPRPLNVEPEADALITYGAHCLDMSREAFVAEAIHRMAAAHGIAVEQALQAAAESVHGSPRADSTMRGRPRRGSS